MIKRTLYFGNPLYLSFRNSQMLIAKPHSETLAGSQSEQVLKTVPIEDLGVVVMDNKRITVTSGLLSALMDNNVAVITCDDKSMPQGLLLPLASNILQSERYEEQMSASVPLKKQLWQQTIENKIRNQAAVLNSVYGEPAKNMLVWASNVKSGDSENMEARAAAYYWRNVFVEHKNFVRDRDGSFPNNLLNYGYAILRAIMARSLVAKGLLPTLGIHHHNRYNAYCLADDIMEPYRPYVDSLVLRIIESNSSEELDVNTKSLLLGIPVLDVTIDGHRSPLMIAVETTVNSLYKCFSGESRKIIYPQM